MAPNRARRIFVPTNPDLADILGRTDLDFENFNIFDFLDPNVLDVQVSRSPNFWISRSPDLQIRRFPRSQISRFAECTVAFYWEEGNTYFPELLPTHMDPFQTKLHIFHI